MRTCIVWSNSAFDEARKVIKRLESGELRIPEHYSKAVLENYLDKAGRNIENLSSKDIEDIIKKRRAETASVEYENNEFSGKKFVQEAQDRFAKDKDEAKNDLFIQRVLELGIPIEYVDSFGENKNTTGKPEREILGMYNPDANKIIMSRKASIDDVRHECVHAVTAYYLNYPKSKRAFLPSEIRKAIYDIEDCYKIVKTYDDYVTKNDIENVFRLTDEYDRYGLTNAAEFVAEVVANPVFRNYIKHIDAVIYNTKEESLLKRIWNGIRRLFNIKKNNESIERTAIMAINTLKNHREFKANDVAGLRRYLGSEKINNNSRSFETKEDMQIYTENAPSNINFKNNQVIINTDNQQPYLVKDIVSERGVHQFKYILINENNISRYSYEKDGNGTVTAKYIHDVSSKDDIEALKIDLSTSEIFEIRDIMARQFDERVRLIRELGYNSEHTKEKLKNLTDEELIALIGVDNIFDIIHINFRRRIDAMRKTRNSELLEDAARLEKVADDINFNTLKNMAIGKSLITSKRFLDKHRESGLQVVPEDYEELDEMTETAESNEDADIYGDLETEAQSVNGFEYDKAACERNMFENANKKAKLLLSTCKKITFYERENPETKAKETRAKYVRNSFGIEKYVDLESMYTTLIDLNSNTFSPEDFLNNIKEKLKITTFRPILQDLYNKLVNEQGKIDEDMLNCLYSATKCVSPTVVQVKQTEVNGKEECYVNPLNTTENSENLVRSWRMLIQPLNSKKLKELREKPIEIEGQEYKVFTKKPTAKDSEILWNAFYKKAIQETFNSLNLPLDTNVLNIIETYDNNNNTSKIKNIYDILADIFNITINEKEENPNIVNSARNQFTKLADILTEFIVPETMSSFYFDGKLMFSAIPCSRITDVIAQFNRPTEYETGTNGEATAVGPRAEFIRENFQKVAWFGYDPANDSYKNDWLTQLSWGSYKPEIVIQKYFTKDEKFEQKNGQLSEGFRDKSSEIKSLTKEEYLQSYKAMYDRGSSQGKGYTYYPVPNLSDSGNQLYMLGPKYESEYKGVNEEPDYSVFYDKFTDLGMQELERAARIYDRQDIEPKRKIENYDIELDSEGNIKKLGGAQFVFMPDLNDFRFYEGNDRNNTKSLIDLYRGVNKEEGENNGVIHLAVNPFTENTENKTFNTVEEALRWCVERVANNAYENYLQEYNGCGVIGYNDQEFFFNQMYAYNSIVQLTVGDLAYYKSNGHDTILDFQKRFKGIFGRTTRLGVGENEQMSFMIIDDEEIKSEFKEAIDVWLNSKNNQDLTEADKEVIRRMLLKIVNTDGQGLVHPKALHKMYSAMGTANPKVLEVLKLLSTKEGRESIKGSDILRDFSIYFNPIKPFVQTNYIKQIDADENESIPLQIKDSEMLFCPILSLGNMFENSPKLQALFEIMEENGIDRIQFKSSIKSGVHGVLKVEGETKDEIKKNLADALVGDAGQGNYIKRIPYSAYGIQTRTDANDEIATRGSQQSKVMMANLNKDQSFDVDLGGNRNVKLNGDEIREVYIAATNALVNKDAETLSKKLGNNEGISREMTDKFTYGINADGDLASGFALNSLGDFVVPLSDPTIDDAVFNALASTIKRSVTKRTTKGKTYIQATSWGVSSQLHAIFEFTGEDGKKHEITEQNYKEFRKKTDKKSYLEWMQDQWKNHTISLKAIEVYAGCPDKVVQELLTDANGKVDINKEVEVTDKDGNIVKVPVYDKRLREFVGYRIPTEGNCSIFNCRVKDFLPNIYGETVLVPAEFVAITGSDFDIDKMFSMIYEYDTVTSKGKNNEITKRLVKKTIPKKVISGQTTDKNGVVSENKPITKDELINAINSKLDKKTIANLLIDLTRTINSNPTTLSRNLHPSSYPYSKNLSYFIEGLRGMTKEDYDALVKKDSRYGDISEILKMDPKELEKFADEHSKKTIPMTLQSVLNIHENNNSGKTLIGMYAVATGLHNIFMSVTTKCDFMQNFSIGSDSRYEKIKDKKSKDKESENIKKPYSTNTFRISHDRNGRLVSYNCGENQASSVDNGKDPILYLLGQNPFTAPLANIMILSGYTLDDVALFFNQPAILQFVKEYQRRQNDGVSFPNLKEIGETVKGILKLGNITSDVSALYTDTMIQDILGTGSTEDEIIDWKKRQLKALDMLMTLDKGASSIRTLSKFLRADTMNAGMPSTQAKFIKYALEYDKIGTTAIEIEGFNALGGFMNKNQESTTKEGSYKTTDYLINFFTKGIKNPANSIIFEQQPQLKEILQSAQLLYGGTIVEHISDRSINDLINGYTKYIYDDFFGTEESLDSHTDAKGNPIKFVTYFEDMQKSDKYKQYFKENYFLKHFVVDQGSAKTKKRLVFNKANKLNRNMREMVKMDWENMLKHSDKAIRDLAIDLFKYSYFSSTFDFTYEGFSQYIPTAVKEATVSVVDGKTISYVDFTKTKYGHKFANDEDVKQFVRWYVTKNSNVLCASIDNLVVDDERTSAKYDENHNIIVNTPMKSLPFVVKYNSKFRELSNTDDNRNGTYTHTYKLLTYNPAESSTANTINSTDYTQFSSEFNASQDLNLSETTAEQTVPLDLESQKKERIDHTDNMLRLGRIFANEEESSTERDSRKSNTLFDKYSAGIKYVDDNLNLCK